MLSCFNLKPGFSIDDFSISLQDFANHMKNLDLMVSVGSIGSRDSETPMDTDEERNHSYFFVTTFLDKGQCDRSYEYILGHTESGDAFHDAVYKQVEDPVFICYEDIG